MTSYIKKTYKLYRNYFYDYIETRAYQVQCFNSFIYDFNTYLASKHTPNHWLYRFLMNRIHVDRLTKEKIAIFGINGDKRAIQINNAKYKIFYTVENIHDEGSFWSQYEDLLLQDTHIQLSIGYDYLANSNYIRFPFWLMRLFDPEDNYTTIKNKCNLIEQSAKENKKERFCAFICRNDYNGDRTFFLSLLNQLDTVDCPSQFQHNDDSLITIHNNNKLSYLSSYKFNLCPENSNYKGYVTEKLFDAVLSGCIPIYWGSENQPEPDILNQNRILFLSIDQDNNHISERILSMHKDYRKFQLFSNQPIFTRQAPEIIYDYFKNLENKIIGIF